MKAHWLALAGAAALLAMSGSAAVAQDPDKTVGQDLKAAGRDTKAATKKAAENTEHGTKKAARATKRGANKGIHKTAAATERGAEKVERKTENQ